MPEPMVRGHVIRHTAEFFRDDCDPALALRVESAIPIELRGLLQDVSPAGWYPRRLQVELLHAITLALGSDEAAHAELERCGAKIALANNDFMMLLTKLLTPELFLRKAERFWARDHQYSGRCELDALDTASCTARVRLCEVGGYAHAALTWLGFMRCILDKLVSHRPLITQEGWSWSEPAPDEILYHVRWS